MQAKRLLAKKKAASKKQAGGSAAAAAAAAKEAKERAKKKGKSKDSTHYNQVRPSLALRCQMSVLIREVSQSLLQELHADRMRYVWQCCSARVMSASHVPAVSASDPGPTYMLCAHSGHAKMIGHVCSPVFSREGWCPTSLPKA